MDITAPDYSGRSLVNLVAELEHRLGGSPPSARLHHDLAGLIPVGNSYVLVLFDGLGDHQLGQPVAASLRNYRVGAIDAPFPTTTTVSLASIATGLTPLEHGLLGYQLWMPQAGQVMNTIRWTTLWGDALDVATADFLPQPNTWERLRAAGKEPVTVQPANFEESQLSRALYRGCRFEGIMTVTEWAEATAMLAAEPGRLVFAYLPQVDFAAHVYGQDSAEYRTAVTAVSGAWEDLVRRLPSGAVAVGTADHGHVDFHKHQRHAIPRLDHAERVFYGDGRVMFVKGEGASLAASLPARWVPLQDMQSWWGAGEPHKSFGERSPDGALVADDDELLLHRFSDDRMIGNHGGLTDAERKVPLLVTDGEQGS